MKDLLQPRYLVIADYPKAPFEIGMILAQDKRTIGEVFVLESEMEGQDRNFIMPDDIDKYPHLFRKLQWWEHREIMPEYIKIVDENSIVRIHTITKDIGFHYFDGNHWRRKVFSTNTEPATQTDFINYTSKKIMNYEIRN